jgi:hypothetical protein
MRTNKPSSSIAHLVAFALGLFAIGWIGHGFIGTNTFGLLMTLAIACVYVTGAQEIRRFRATGAALRQALHQVPQPLDKLADWLTTLPPALQNPVRQRIEGERGALPGLALTPYLIGLLVMLGMLGTFLGMVVTFQGAVFTLEGSADLQAIRSALSAPIKGLGLAFGTSVVGVATSAMLGLMSAIARRERMGVLRLLDAKTATDFFPFTLAHQRQAHLQTLQQQAGVLPAVANQLQALMDQIERRSQQLDTQLLVQQAQFQQDASAAYTGLAQSVERSLKEALVDSARLAGESTRDVVAVAMTAFSHSFAQRSTTMLTEVQQAVSQTLAQTASMLDQRLQDSMGATAKLIAQSEALVLARIESEAAWAQQHGERMDQLAQVWRTELASLRSEEAARGDAAVTRLGELQTAINAQVTSHLEMLGTALEAPMTRLLETASEAPKAAAEVIAQLRQEMSQLAERDNHTLTERAMLVGNISSLLQTVQQTTGDQRAAIEQLVTSASAVFDQVSRQFAETSQAQAARAEGVAEQVSSSAANLANLGEAFGNGVQQFSSSNEKLIESLQRVEGAVSQSMARSDEQLAYYVAQAREVIDLSITSQQSIVEDLRRLRVKPAMAEATP